MTTKKVQKRKALRKSAYDLSKMSENQKRNFANSLKQYQPIIIRWADAWSKGGWLEPTEFGDPPIITNIGFNLMCDNNYLFIAHGFATDENVAGFFAIPLGTILSVQLL